MTRRMAIVFMFLNTLSAMAYAEAERGMFGFSLTIETEGVIWNPILQSVTIDKVIKASPAAKAGILVGDQLVELEGRVVAGARAKELEPLIKKFVGQPLNMRLKHANGELYSVTMIAVGKS